MTALFKLNFQPAFVKGIKPEDLDKTIAYIKSLPHYDIEVDSICWHPAPKTPTNTNNSWPIQCTNHTADATVVNTRKVDYIAHKGLHTSIWNTDHFFNNTTEKEGEIKTIWGTSLDYTSLLDFIKEEDIKTIDVVGLPLEIEVKAFVQTALNHQLNVRVLCAGCLAFNTAQGLTTLKQLWQAGAEIN